jgi:PAS domain S-box-containing protein
MNNVSMIPLVASLLYFLLFVFSLRVKRRVNRIFSLYLLALGLWSFCSFIWHADSPVIGDPRWLQASAFFGISYVPLLYHFVVTFLGLDTKPIFRVGLWAMYGLLFVVLLGDIHGDLIRATRLERGQFDVQFGSVAYPAWVYASLGIITCFVLLARASVKTRDDRNQRNRLLYLAISSSLGVVGTFANISPQLRPYPFDHLFNLAGASLMAYAIYRYQLLDLSFVIRRGLAYSVLAAGIAATYLLTIFAVERLARTVFGYGAYLIPILVAIAIAVAFQPLRDRAQTWVDRLFFREKYDAQQMLHRLSQTAASILDLNVLGGMLLEEVTTTMHIAGTCILLKEQERGEFYLVAQRGLGKDVTNLKLRRDHPLLRWLARERVVLTAHEIDILPEFKALWGQEKEELKRLGAELFVPLLVKGNLVGLFAFGPKFSQEAYAEDEKITLTTLANQTAVAIENARLHKAAQQELAERKALEEMWRRYEFIVNTSREFMSLINNNYIYEAVNESYCKAHNTTQEGIIGRTAADIWGEEPFNRAIKARLDKCFAGNEVHDQDWYEFAAVGLRYFDVTYYPYYGSEGTVTHAVVVSRDITERKQAEEEKERMQAQLLQSQKMEAIGILAGGVAHDFNNLLTTIIGYSALLLRSLDDHDPLRQDVEAIIKSAQRAAALTRQLLAFSRKQPLQPQVLDLNDLVTNMRKMLERLIGEDIGLVTDLAPALGRTKADPGQIEQVIMNLAVNAREAMPDGGTLTIVTANVTLDEDYCKVIPEARPGSFVCLSVEDTGVGMDEEIMQHIFEPFFSTKEHSTGLGLAVVYGIVKQHEGWIDVSSEPGHGSTFRVYLPAFHRELAEEAGEAVSLEELQGSGERILLVEDDAGVRELSTRALAESGYVVFAAASAEEALDIFEREEGQFHLVFSDVVLTDQSGLQLVDHLRARKPDLPVLLNSGYTDRKAHWTTISERGWRFLQKPYDLADLLRAVREAIKPG